MWKQWWCVVFLAVVSAEYEFNAERYYEMPRLFSLEAWEPCLAARRGVYCLGSFQLLDHSNKRLMDYIQEYSSERYHFSHGGVHRGVCVTSSCGAAPSPRARFQSCVSNATRALYGLEANLTKLEYCRMSGRSTSRPLDELDVAFVCLAAVLLLLNAAGTAYDVCRNQDGKPNKYLVAWSVRGNWARFTASHEGGDPRLAALKPIQGMKVITLLLIMMAHSVLAFHITYILNPLFLERATHMPLSAYFQNGTSIVQTFVLVSSFLLAYNLLLLRERRALSLRMLPACLTHRLVRIVPLYLLVVLFSASWWARCGDGPLWAPLAGAEAARCRRKWWTHLLFVNNLVRPDVRCLIHTWFLAVDMQLYVVSAALTLALRRRAVPVLAALLAVAVVGNAVAAYTFELRPMVALMFPENMRTQFQGSASFTWLYQAPWDSLPAALLGLLLAHAHRAAQAGGFRPNESTIFRILYRLSVPAMFLWVAAGYYVKRAPPAALWLYAAVDRPVFAALVAVAMFGFINQVDSLWWRFLSWRGWGALARLSLPAYLLHWLLALSQLALRHHPSPVSVHEIGGHFLYTAALTYIMAVPLHILVELPTQKFLQMVFS